MKVITMLLEVTWMGVQRTDDELHPKFKWMFHTRVKPSSTKDLYNQHRFKVVPKDYYWYQFSIRSKVPYVQTLWSCSWIMVLNDSHVFHLDHLEMVYSSFYPIRHFWDFCLVTVTFNNQNLISSSMSPCKTGTRCGIYNKTRSKPCIWLDLIWARSLRVVTVLPGSQCLSLFCCQHSGSPSKTPVYSFIGAN